MENDQIVITIITPSTKTDPSGKPVSPAKVRVLQPKEYKALIDSLALALSLRGDPDGILTRTLNTLLGRNKNSV